MALRFIHCADLHLGTPFKAFPERYGNDPEIINRVLYAPEKTLSKIIDSAIANKVDFVLFAGDIMDSVNANWRSISVFEQALRRLKEKNIPSFVIAGNHDAMPNDALKKACHDAVLFDCDDVSYHEIPDKAVIAGISFCEKNAAENLAVKFKRQNQELFHIALYHGDIGGQSTGANVYNPAPVSDLISSNFDYWALGHIHEKAFISEANPVIIYSGATLSHHVNEISPKGFYLIDVDEFKYVKTTFIETSPIAFIRSEIDLSGIDDMKYLPLQLKKQLAALPPSQTVENYFVELVISGKTVLDSELRKQNDDDLCYFVSAELADKYKIGSIVLKTSTAADTEVFIKENIFAADLHSSFENEKKANYAAAAEELAALQRTYGKLLDIQNIDIEKIADDAENELMRILMEDGK